MVGFIFQYLLFKTFCLDFLYAEFSVFNYLCEVSFPYSFSESLSFEPSLKAGMPPGIRLQLWCLLTVCSTEATHSLVWGLQQPP